MSFLQVQCVNGLNIHLLLMQTYNAAKFHNTDNTPYGHNIFLPSIDSRINIWHK